VTEHVRTEVAAGVMTLTLTRADKKNALSNAMYSAMSDGLERAEQDPAIRVVLFQGEGDSFTSGNDLADFSAQANGKDASESQAFRFINNLGKATRPLVAAVQGNAVGVGTTMLLRFGFSCRHRKADDTIRKPGSGPRGGLELAAACAHRPRPRLRHVCAGTATRCHWCICLWLGQCRGAGRRVASQSPGSRRSPD
jgi:hypothetical protein